jgi:hypothetical protein
MPILTLSVLSTGELVGQLRQIAGLARGDDDHGMASPLLEIIATRIESQAVITPAAALVASYPYGASDGVRVDVRVPLAFDEARHRAIRNAVFDFLPTLERASAEATPVPADDHGPGGPAAFPVGNLWPAGTAAVKVDP